MLNCGASCDGTSPSCQFAGTSVVCSGPLCANDHTSATAFCTGDGKCNNPLDTLCGASGQYACTGSGQCNSGCRGDGDCASTPFHWACNTAAVPAKPYCAFPLAHACNQGSECGSNICTLDRSTQKPACCNEPCQAGTTGGYCMGYVPSTGQYLAWTSARGAFCNNGVCTAVIGWIA